MVDTTNLKGILSASQKPKTQSYNTTTSLPKGAGYVPPAPKPKPRVNTTTIQGIKEASGGVLPPIPPMPNTDSQTTKKPSGGSTNTLSSSPLPKATQEYVAPVLPVPVVYNTVFLTGGTQATKSSVKIATSNNFITSETFYSSEAIASLLFGELSASELANVTNNYNVVNNTIKYQPIVGISELLLKYNPQSVAFLQAIDREYFDNFPLFLENYIPYEGNGLNGDYVYINEEGDLVVELVNIDDNLRVEIEILKFDSVISDTIY